METTIHQNQVQKISKYDSFILTPTAALAFDYSEEDVAAK